MTGYTPLNLHEAASHLAVRKTSVMDVMRRLLQTNAFVMHPTERKLTLAGPFEPSVVKGVAAAFEARSDPWNTTSQGTVDITSITSHPLRK